ncbi:unnamed protein product [Paramecium sonneborni]|uniref:Copine n=1 Tax=Paramecium sonneborni TaxID=65129 RepID=A0A8S1KIU6_9CILI|nr:unnamed protein product [Paramecium sonneborni]
MMHNSQIEQSQFSEAIQKLELFISCRQLDDLDTVTVSDPYVIMYQKNNNYWTKIGQTELIWNNLNPNFATSIQLEYHFEVQQHLKMEVHHYISPTQSKIIGIAETTVAEIAGSKDQIFMGDLVNISGKKSGKIIVKADQVKSCNDELIITLSGQSIPETRFWFWHGTCPFLRFYRLRKDDNNPVLVYETEFAKDTTQPLWKQINCKAQKLCNGDYQMPIKVELWDYRSSGKHIYLGETTFCVEELKEHSLQSKILKKEFRNKMKKNESAGILQFNKFQLKTRFTFLDYCAGGQQLNLIVAIDFTASNGNPNDPKSLHFMTQNGAPSQYLQAIISVVEILINYDHDKKVPIYGFGCKPRMNLINTNQTLHLFPLNDNPDDPEVYGLDGIVQCYRSSLHRLAFDGPTYLHPILKNAMDMAQTCKNQGSENYLILMILTDGQTNDMQASIDDIIASSHLPLSVIIIGIGDANFKNMSILDNDDKSMVDSKGNKAIRDLVQFVPFNEFKNDPALLSKEVLAELPDQLVEYMELMNIPPKPPHNIQVNQYQMPGNNISQQNIGIPPNQQYNVYPQNPQFQNDQDSQKYLSQNYQQYPQQPNQYPPPQQQQFPPQQLFPPQQEYPPQQVYPPQQYPPQQNYQYQQLQQPQTGMATKSLGQGLAQQGFLKGFVQQANQQFNYPSQ